MSALSRVAGPEIPEAARPGGRVGPYVIRAHLAFIVSWAVAAAAYRPLAELIAQLVSPFYWIVSMFDPGIERLYSGEMSRRFYALIASETFGVGIAWAVVVIASIGWRYRTDPTEFISFISKRLRCKEISIPMLVGAVICAALAWVLWQIFPYWYGFTPYPESAGPIRIHQLALWSFIAGAAPLALSLAASYSILYVLRALKRLCLRARASSHVGDQ
jgi:hypothetical protein